MKINKFVFISVAIIMMLSGTLIHAGPPWTHAEQATWGAIEDTTQTEVPKMYPYATCAIGKNQSPVDLAAATIKQSKDQNRLGVWYEVDDAPVFFNNGSEVVVNTSLDYQGQLVVGDEVFQLIQFHFHSPSEHVLGPTRFPAELHYVHVRDDGRIIVVAAAVVEGERNETMQTILDNTPSTPNQKNENSGISINPMALLPPNYHRPDAWSMAGSLTTPPCTENVQWYFLQEVVTISTEQLEQLRAFYFNDYREVQDLNGRSLI